MLDWDRRPDGTWRAWVIYLVDEPGGGSADEVDDVGDVGEAGRRRLPVQGWVDRADLRPAR
ncbi:hypothetical protein GCM10025868_46470 [Angustibacter aerolatus]|uniref:Uncharacterized protein n=1 Tax=Angustibacter aerolatus TaxID=1162965 RepID=A0ABQ6JM94_9ACTN|nr:hypothetical protein [Angustibacter aerolatus]GMA89397.1 hypothetical protein GCM10025868_46470 [Angustibacter aerolatus]